MYRAFFRDFYRWFFKRLRPSSALKTWEPIFIPTCTNVINLGQAIHFSWQHYDTQQLQGPLIEHLIILKYMFCNSWSCQSGTLYHSSAEHSTAMGASNTTVITLSWQNSHSNIATQVGTSCLTGHLHQIDIFCHCFLPMVRHPLRVMFTGPRQLQKGNGQSRPGPLATFLEQCIESLDIHFL